MSDITLAPRQRRGLRRSAALTIATAATLVAALITPATADAAPAAESTALYIVQLAGDPIAAYSGGVAGIPATRPAGGAKLDPTAWNYTAYRRHLQAKRADALKRAGVAGSVTVADYGVTFNGFSARLTVGQVAKLRTAAGVVNVFKNRVHTGQTAVTPDFLGLSGANGVWQSQFGGRAGAGEGMIIGVIDSGYWPENPSFRALPEPRPDAEVIAGKWRGTCDTGDEAPVSCNNKVIGARWYNEGGLGNRRADEYLSPRDRNGHGSHTASTAAGMPTAASVAGSPIGEVSGMAPAARLSVYKALWHQDGGSASGNTVDLVQAIDDAVADGVDVINYSIGDDDDVVGPEDLAFMFAAAAGIFVATSAGNAGPGAGTVDNAMPWQTTVGAGTHTVKYAKTVTLGNGASYEGVGLGPAVASAGLVDAASVPAAGTTLNAALCQIGSLDPARVAGKIVLCQRGVNNRVDKSEAVRLAGGVGTVLFNPGPNSLNAETHSTPTVHVGPAEGTAIKAYIAGAGAGATASLSATVMKSQVGPGVTPFSSVGPSNSSGGDLLKPDLIAPGVDIAAAVPPVANPANSFHDIKSGTSMASPHVAGIAALIKAKNPGWSPSAIKSAMMTTAYQTNTAGQPIARVDLGADATPLEYGSGHVRPAAAFNPGLIYDSGPPEWSRYLCGIGTSLVLGDGTPLCDVVDTVDPSNLNYPSIAVGDLAGKQTVTRTVTNTTNQASVYFAKVQAPPGISVKVTPSVLTVLPRRSATYTVEFTRTTAAFGEYTSGSLTWADLRGHSVRSPLAVNPTAVAAPAEATGAGASGSRELPIRAGYNGTLGAAVHGLVAPTTQVAHLVGTQKNFNVVTPTAGPAVARLTVTAPDSAKAVRFATFNSDLPTGADVDLFVYRDGELVGQSTSGDSDEAVTLLGGGTLEVYVVQFALGSGRTEEDVRLRTFTVTPGAVGNATVTPASRAVTVGQAAPVTVAWSGLTPGTPYFGLVEYSDGTASIGYTQVEVRA